MTHLFFVVFYLDTKRCLVDTLMDAITALSPGVYWIGTCESSYNLVLPSLLICPGSDISSKHKIRKIKSKKVYYLIRIQVFKIILIRAIKQFKFFGWLILSLVSSLCLLSFQQETILIDYY